jgi:hypothetical protein
MVSILEAFLMLVGFAALVAVADFFMAVWLLEQLPPDDTEPVLIDGPYDEALDASGRISARGFEAQRLMHELAQQNGERRP